MPASPRSLHLPIHCVNIPSLGHSWRSAGGWAESELTSEIANILLFLTYLNGNFMGFTLILPLFHWMRPRLGLALTAVPITRSKDSSHPPPTPSLGHKAERSSPLGFPQASGGPGLSLSLLFLSGDTTFSWGGCPRALVWTGPEDNLSNLQWAVLRMVPLHWLLTCVPGPAWPPQGTTSLSGHCLGVWGGQCFSCAWCYRHSNEAAAFWPHSCPNTPHFSVGVSSHPCSGGFVIISLLFLPAWPVAHVGPYWWAQLGFEFWLQHLLACINFFGVSGSHFSHLLKGDNKGACVIR